MRPLDLHCTMFRICLIGPIIFGIHQTPPKELLASGWAPQSCCQTCSYRLYDKPEEEAERKALHLQLVQQECETIRAAAIEQATREAEREVARILADAQASARQQAAEERDALRLEAREQAQAII